MNIKIELLKDYISELVANNLGNIEIDADNIADSVAIQMLSEIQEIIKNEEYSDFDAIEKIVCVFEKYRIDIGTRHDF